MAAVTKTLAITAAGEGAGIGVDVSSPTDMDSGDMNRAALAILHIPALNAWTHTLQATLDGTNWYNVTADLDGTVWPTTTSTAQRGVFGPFATGSNLRLTSSVAQTAVATVALVPR